MKHNELHLLLERGQGLSYFQDVQAAAGEIFYKHDYLTTSITGDAKISPDALFGFYAEVVRRRQNFLCNFC